MDRTIITPTSFSTYKVRFVALTSLLIVFATALLGQDSARAQKVLPGAVFKRLHSFCSKANCGDGEYPGPLLQGLDGNFYGSAGGVTSNTSCPNGCGIIFKMTPSGAVSTFYSFCSQANCSDGMGASKLILGPDGNFYGLTGTGGIVNSTCPNGCGTVFRLTPTGVLTTLYSFNLTDGSYPAGLILGSDGNFYGTLILDIFNEVTTTVFRLSPQGSFSAIEAGFHEIIYLSFQGTDTTIYGTTTPVCDQYCQVQGGTILATTPQGAGTMILDFCPAGTGCTNGANPSSLFRGADGNFYGTTYEGGNINNLYNGQCGFGCGTVFKVTPAGILTTLYDFCSLSNCVDGALPDALLQGTDGDFYGATAQSGGAYNGGTLFKVTPAGTLTTLYNFCALQACVDGFLPGSVLQGTDGNFYGTTGEGGYKGVGTAFSLSTGLGPFVRTLPTSGQIGSTVRILGTNLSGATAVAFNGIPATFAVGSKTYIVAKVPPGATSGRVTVTTPNGTLKSNTAFLVR